MAIPVNRFNTQLTDELLNSLHPEVRDNLLEAIANIKFIQRLIDPDRKFARDLPRDKDGKIIVDILNPHILEDMDYFRPTAKYYEEHGVLTHLRPNSNPNSDFGKWMKTEIERIWYGMIRPSDGEWIPGPFYWYLNYMPIVKDEVSEDGMIADRVDGFPNVWDGLYLWFHYIHQARYGGIYNDFKGGQHCIQLAKRGASKSYGAAGLLSRLFVIGDSPKSSVNTKGMVMAYDKQKLIVDGTLNKFLKAIDFQANYTQFPASRLKSTLDGMQWKMGYKDKITGLEKGTLNETMGVAINDDVRKGAGKRPIAYTQNVLTPDGWKKWKDIQVGDYLYGEDGSPTKVIAIPFDGEEELYEITLKDKRKTIVGKDHLFDVLYWKNSKNIRKTLSVDKMKDNFIYIRKPDSKGHVKNHYKYSIPKNECLEFKENPLLIDPYVMGMYLGDGSWSNTSCDRINITMLRNDFDDLEKYIPYKVVKSYLRDIDHYICLLGDGTKKAEYCNYAHSILTYYGLGRKICKNKFIPKEYLYNSKENRTKLLKGLLDTDGTCDSQGGIEYASVSKQLAEDVVFLCRSLGINCGMYIKDFHHERYYRVNIFASDRQLFNLKRKQNRVRTKITQYAKSYIDKTSIINIKPIGRGMCKCVTVDNESHTFLIDDFIVTHNCNIIIYEEIGQFKGFLEVWNTMRRSVQSGNISFGQMIGVGTSGEANSSFYGILEMLYSPAGYNIYALKNFYDKGSNGDGTTVFFFGGYLNRAGCMNHDGVSDVIKALIEIFEERFKVKYSANDPATLTRVIAEDPITIQEAIMRKDGSIFPAAMLSDRLNEIKANPKILDDVYVGMLKQNSKGEIEFDPTADVKAIRHYPHRDNKLEGAIQIFKMPEKDNSGKVFSNRYILSADPYDNDTSETMSLGAVYVLDLWTDKIVAEYVGRPQFADELYDICLKLCLFYNGQLLYENNYKGLFGFFSRKNCMYLLSDVPQFLKDRDLVKGESYGNVSKGCRATTPILNYGMKELRDWLLKETFITEIDSEGNEIHTTIPNLMHIKSPALLEELIQWNPENNFDRVSSLIMMMLIRQDKLKYIEGKNQDELRNRTRAGYLGNDPFFKKNSPKKQSW